MAVFSSLVILSQTASIRTSVACIEKKDHKHDTTWISAAWYHQIKHL